MQLKMIMPSIFVLLMLIASGLQFESKSANNLADSTLIEPVAGPQHQQNAGWVIADLFEGEIDAGKVGVARDVIVDSNYQMYVVGYFSGTILFSGGSTLSSSGGIDIFVAKFGSSGLEWQIAFGGISDDIGTDIEIGYDGRVIVAGMLGTDDELCDAIRCGFISGIDQISGDLLFTRFIASYESDAVLELTHLEIDSQGHMYVGGYSFGEYQLEDSECIAREQIPCLIIQRTEEVDGFIARLSHSAPAGVLGGNYLEWTDLMNLDHAAYDDVESLVVGEDGSIYFGGSFVGEFYFAGQTISSIDNERSSYFVAAFDSDGGQMWIHSATSTSHSSIKSMAMTPLGDIVATGWFRDTIRISNEDHTSLGETDLFLLELDPVGEIQWSNSLSSSDYLEPFDMDVAPNGAIFVGLGAGNSVQTTLADDSEIEFTHYGEMDIFIAKFLQDGTFILGGAAGSAGMDVVYGLDIDGDNDLYAVGYTSGETHFGWDYLTDVGTTVEPYLAYFYQDSDWDGLYDYGDRCPLTNDVTLLDSDNDGYYDDWEQPNWDGDLDADACDSDVDGDGVANEADDCSFTIYGSSVDEFGCSILDELDVLKGEDDDGDGVSNDLDKCPTSLPELTVDWYGCSSMEVDADADGIVDQLDSCRSTAKGATVDDEGCVMLADTLAGPISISGLLVLLIGAFTIFQRRFGEGENELDHRGVIPQAVYHQGDSRLFSSIELVAVIAVMITSLFVAIWNVSVAGVLLIGTFIAQLAWSAQKKNPQTLAPPMPEKNISFQYPAQQYQQHADFELPARSLLESQTLPQQPIQFQEQVLNQAAHTMPTQNKEIDDLLSDLFE